MLISFVVSSCSETHESRGVGVVIFWGKFVFTVLLKHMKKVFLFFCDLFCLFCGLHRLHGRVFRAKLHSILTTSVIFHALLLSPSLMMTMIYFITIESRTCQEHSLGETAAE